MTKGVITIQSNVYRFSSFICPFFCRVKVSEDTFTNLSLILWKDPRFLASHSLFQSVVFFFIKMPDNANSLSCKWNSITALPVLNWTEETIAVLFDQKLQSHVLFVEKHQTENLSWEGFIVNKGSNVIALTSRRERHFKAHVLELSFLLDNIKWLLQEHFKVVFS